MTTIHKLDFQLATLNILSKRTAEIEGRELCDKITEKPSVLSTAYTYCYDLLRELETGGAIVSRDGLKDHRKAKYFSIGPKAKEKIAELTRIKERLGSQPQSGMGGVSRA
jgi:DNA-binding PadR family transcriptional regulator